MTATPSATALCRALGLGDSPGAVLVPLRGVYARVDEEVSRRTAGIGLPCRSGCDACCHEAVFVSAPEFFAVAVYLLEHEVPGRRREIVAEMTKWADVFEDELLLLEALPPGDERDEVARRVRFRCPLLDGGGRCSVYGARELNARTFGATVDEARDAPFGCGLTYDRLRVLPPSASSALLGARQARQWLREEVPGAAEVHVYPWWFSRFAQYLVDGRS